jgi:hypothetical protein
LVFQASQAIAENQKGNVRKISASNLVIKNVVAAKNSIPGLVGAGRVAHISADGTSFVSFGHVFCVIWQGMLG